MGVLLGVSTHSARYGSHERHRIDIHRPRRAVAPCPVVVFFYGGRWKQGRRQLYQPMARALARHGLVVAVPDYRLYPQVRFPGFVEDAAAAVDWVFTHASEWEGDGSRVFLAGHSAGAHIAALLALDGRYLGLHGRSPADLAGMVGLAGPYDFLPFRDEDLKEIFAPVEQYPASQPINFVDGRNPPLLLLHGSKDKIVGPGNSKRLWRRIVERGGRARMAFLSHHGHMKILLSLFPGLGWLGPPVRREFLDFTLNGQTGLPAIGAEPVSYD